MNLLEQYPIIQPMLSSFTEEELALLHVMHFAPNERVVTKNQRSRDIYILTDGICNVMKDLPNGQTIISYQLFPLDIAGFGDVSNPNSYCYSTISTVSNVTALRLNKNNFYRLHAAHQEFALFLLRTVLGHMHNSMKFASICKSNSTAVNILYYLSLRYEAYRLTYPQEYAGYVKIHETRPQISAFLNLDIRSLNRHIYQFKEQNMVHIIKGKIHINQKQYESILERL